MPCNTAHAPIILDAVRSILREKASGVRLIHMIQETGVFLQRHYPEVRTVGLLATTGTVRSGIYQESLSALGIRVLVPPDAEQEEVVHRAIYDPQYGIKARSSPVTEQARQFLLDALHHLVERGAEAILLGCTEIPLAIHETRIGQSAVIDPSRILARALIEATYPERLKS
jgi:aspartate racemase